MATYKEIQAYVKEQHGFTVETCHIAHVLDDHVLLSKRAPNRIDPLKRKKPCPNGKRKAIQDAIKHFGMIS
jgi:hypothetical protein